MLTTASTDEKLEKAKELGADAGINYKTEDVAARVRELTGGQGVDVALDHIGASVWEQCFASLKTGGTFINCGVSAGYRTEFHLGQLWTRELTIMGSRMKPREDMPAILPLFCQGQPQACGSSRLPAGGSGQSPPRHGGVRLLWQGGADGVRTSGSTISHKQPCVSLSTVS